MDIEDEGHGEIAGEGEATPTLEDIAREMGWKPQDEFRGNPEDWKPAHVFVRTTGEINRSLKSTLRETEKHAERAVKAADRIIEQERAKALKEAEERLRLATQAQDEDAAVKAAEAIAEARNRPAESHSERDDFIRRNPWFNADPVAKGIALGAAQRAAERGAPASEQFEAAESEVRLRMPELFGEAQTPRKAPPITNGGQRAATPVAPRVKGWAQIPEAHRQAAEKAFIRKGRMTQEEYAKTYWQENA